VPSPQKVFILTERSLHNGPRIIREIEALKKTFTLFATGSSAPADTSVKFTLLSTLNSMVFKVANAIARRLFRFGFMQSVFEQYPGVIRFVKNEKIDIVIIHEASFLPCAVKMKKKLGVKIVFNAHEYHPLEFDQDPTWLATIGRYNKTLYKQYLPQLDLLINVCDGIAEKCVEEFGVQSLVVPNAAFQSFQEPTNHEGLPIRMIYHGGVIPSRRIEDMIDVAVLLSETHTLDIMATVQPHHQDYYTFLKKKIEKVPTVRFIEAVPFKDIVPTIAAYDIGIYLLSSESFNNRHALPNKLFEFIQAKLAIAISPSPEMKKVVEKYQLGVVADDFSPQNLASKIAQLTREDIQRFKQNAVKASSQESAEYYSQAYLQAVKQLAGEH